MAQLLNHPAFRNLLRRFPRLQYVGWSLEAMLLGIFWFVCARLSPRGAADLGRRLMGRLGPRLGKHRHVLANLAIVRPGTSAAETEQLGRKVWENFGAVLAEYPHLSTLLNDRSRATIEVRLDDTSRQIIESGQTAIFAVPHLGNWELIAGVIVDQGVPLSAIFSPQRNPFIDRMVQKRRRALNCRFLTKQSALRNMLHELREGRSIGLLPDQRVDSGKPVPFFGLAALTTVSAARIALRQHCEVIPVRMERLPGDRFRATFFPPISRGNPADPDDRRALAMTTELNRLFAEWIKEHPDQWLCTKRRWPKHRPGTAAPA